MATRPKFIKTVAVRDVDPKYSDCFNWMVKFYRRDLDGETRAEARARIFEEMVEAKVREEFGEEGVARKLG